MSRRLKLGTRGSELALWQARETARRLPGGADIEIIKTAGDQRQDIPLQGQLEQGFFTKEIERQLMSGAVDAAVHSLKDLPTQLPPGLVLAAILPRAAVSDLLMVHPEWHDPAAPLPLKAGCPVGAMSLRRQALLRVHGPQAEARMIRGNVPTRLERCAAGEYGALILARAGVERLGLKPAGLVRYELQPELWPCAPGQGAVAVEARADDAEALAILAQIDDEPTRRAVELERRLLANFEGGCHTAFAAWARLVKHQWEVLLGLELAGQWQQAWLHGDHAGLALTGPASPIAFSIPAVQHQEELCRPAQW